MSNIKRDINGNVIGNIDQSVPDHDAVSGGSEFDTAPADEAVVESADAADGAESTDVSVSEDAPRATATRRARG